MPIRSPTEEIKAYIIAFSRANGSECPNRITYEKGWVEFRSRNGSWVISRKRLADLSRMTAALNARDPTPPAPSAEEGR